MKNLKSIDHEMLAEACEKYAWRCVRVNNWYNGKIYNLGNPFEIYIEEGSVQRIIIENKAESWLAKASQFSGMARYHKKKADNKSGN